MFKLLRRLIFFTVIALIIFFAISLWRGGEPFRWFGKKSEKAGEVIKQKSEEIGQKADRIKKTSEGIKQTTKKVKSSIEKTQEKVKDLTGPNTEKE